MAEVNIACYAAFLLAFVVCILLFPGTINLLSKLKACQVISSDGPKTHMAKQGTPTMGGILITLGSLFTALLIGIVALTQSSPSRGVSTGESNYVVSRLFPILLVFLAYSALGFLDDFLIVKRGKALGLRAREKLVGQFAIAIAFVAWLAYTHPFGDATTTLYAGKGPGVNLGSAYYVIAVLFIVSFSNAVNIADGLDGLVGGMSAITAVALALGILTPALSGMVYSSILCYAIAGACVAFLWFNANPAKVFMGDTGSLGLGAVFAVLAIMTKQEIALLIYGLMFIVEIVSIVVQSGYFKYTRRKYGEGRRVFRMSPLHHHFELSGWPEQLIVTRFWILSTVFAGIGLLGRYGRIW